MPSRRPQMKPGRPNSALNENHAYRQPPVSSFSFTSFPPLRQFPEWAPLRKADGATPHPCVNVVSVPAARIQPDRCRYYGFAVADSYHTQALQADPFHGPNEGCTWARNVLCKVSAGRGIQKSRYGRASVVSGGGDTASNGGWRVWRRERTRKTTLSARNQ
ncbi:hypothetical protein LY76DRAFT_135201 [Colletotrichum caudatum]|nr:hypothetical protein LY76DRAFT_135201 [Colletotrichum caudatum]